MGAKVGESLDLDCLNLEQTKRINEISRGIKPEFNNLIDDFHEKNDGQIGWLFNSVISRNPYLSNVFLSICKVHLAKEFIIENGKSARVFSKEKELINAINSASTNGYNKRFPFELRTKVISSIWFISLINVLKIFFRTVMQLLSRKEDRRLSGLRKKGITLIDTFILKDSIVKGAYQDRYYNGILDFVSDKDKNDMFFLPTFLTSFTRKDVNELNENSKENLLFKFDYLNLGDYWQSFLILGKLKFPKKKFFILGINVTSILKRDFYVNKYDFSSFDGALNYFFAKNIASFGLNVKLLIDWNENQPIDKGLIKGFRDYHPKTPIKGYQGYIISTDYNMYVLPTESEVNLGVIPDELNVMGEALKDSRRTFFDGLKVNTAPAFRFSGVFSGKHTKVENSTFMILIALPIGVAESIGILSMIYSLVEDLLEKNVELILKPHPLLKMSEVENSNYWNDNYEVSYAQFNDVLVKAKILIGNTSSVLVESIVQGVPVIVVSEKNRLIQNPIPTSVDTILWKEVYNQIELTETIKHFMSLDEMKKLDLHRVASALKVKLFERPNKNNVANFLNLKGENSSN